MIDTVFEKARRIGGVARYGRSVPTLTATRGMAVGGAPRRSRGSNVVRRLILLSVLGVLASLAVTASASAATLFTNSAPISIPGSGNASPYPSGIDVSGTTPPTVVSVRPANNARGIKRITNVSASFSEAMRAGSINRNTFELFKAGTTTKIGATVNYDGMGGRALLNPNANLRPGTKYKAVVTTGAKDLSGNELDQNPGAAGNQQKVWFFTTKN